jgi:hypothetical protein
MRNIFYDRMLDATHVLPKMTSNAEHLVEWHLDSRLRSKSSDKAVGVSSYEFAGVQETIHK